MKFTSFKDIILFENDDVIVVNKPPFLSTLDERTGESANLLKMAKGYWEDAQICHRLDKETSGALIIAKNPETYRNVSMQFEHREVNKIYHAVIDGHHQFNHLKVDLPILNLGKSNVSINREEGKRAETIFNTIKFYKHYSLVECKPLTGRMHQIRIHLATQRASIAGDDMYGGRPVMMSKIKRGYKLSKNEEEQPIIKRFALHAKEVGFKLHDDTQLNISAPYPKDFDVLIKMLDKFDS
jgi:23S rRNA pseudouridine955/2504/2580 synthase